MILVNGKLNKLLMMFMLQDICGILPVRNDDNNYDDGDDIMPV